MCGLFGYNGPRAVDLTKLRWLAVENESRGRDSTGVYGKARFRQTGPARTVIKNPEFAAAVRGSKNVIGHTRSATSTDGNRIINADNAHPHIGDGPNGVQFVGAHNGFIIDEVFRDLVKQHNFPKAPTVDSMLIYWILAKEYPNFDVLGEIEGAMALNFTIPTRNPDRLYLYKRQSRTLHIGQANDGIYYSSEQSPLELIGCTKIFMLPDNYMWVFENGELIESFRIKDPKIKSLPEGANKNNWDWKVPKEEYSHIKRVDDYKRKTPHERSGSEWNNSASRWECDGEYWNHIRLEWIPIITNGTGVSSSKKDFRTTSTVPKTTNVSWDLVTERLGGLMDAIRAEDQTLDTIPIDYRQTQGWDRNDLLGNILIVTLLAQEKKPLAAWAVYDKNDSSITGMTGPYGSTAIYFPPEVCAKEHMISISGPLDSKVKYDFKFTPAFGRVVEVTLDIPFQKRASQFRKIEEKSYVRRLEGGAGTGQTEQYPQSSLDFAEVGQDTGTTGETSKQLQIGGSVSQGSENQPVAKNLTASVSNKKDKVSDDKSAELIIANIVESQALYITKINPLNGYIKSVVDAEKKNLSLIHISERLGLYPQAQFIEREQLIHAAIRINLAAVEIYKVKLRYIDIFYYLISRNLKSFTRAPLTPKYLLSWISDDVMSISSHEDVKKNLLPIEISPLRVPKPNLPLKILGTLADKSLTSLEQDINGEIWKYTVQGGKGVWQRKYHRDFGDSFLNSLFDTQDDVECSDFLALSGMQSIIRKWSYQCQKIFQIFKFTRSMQLPDGWAEKLLKAFKIERTLTVRLGEELKWATGVVARADDKKTPMFINQPDAKKLIALLATMDRYIQSNKSEYETLLEELETGKVARIEEAEDQYADWAGI